MPRTHHVIVGGSIAGVSAATAMRQHGYDGGITVIDSEPPLPYERPPLSKPAAPERPTRPIFPAEHYAEQGIDLLLGTPVRRLDGDRRRVELGDGQSLPADQVLLATGVLCRSLGVPGEDLVGVHALRTAENARKLFASLAHGGPLVVVGGGFIGLEVAAVARTAGLDVTVVEAGEHPLQGPLGPAVARLVTRRHEARGVRIITRETVRCFTGSGAVEEVVLSGGRRLPAATVVVGVGVRPNDRLAREAGVTCLDGIVVDRHGRTDRPWLWAAGDVASRTHPALAGRGRIEHWDAAMRHGQSVGAGLAGRPSTDSTTPYFWSDQYGTSLQMFGRAGSRDQVVLRSGASPERFLAYWLRGDRLVAVAGLGDPRAVRVARAVMEAGKPVSAQALAEPATDLRQLIRPGRRPGV
ncbi:FAD-dependent oxidoreductase [Streptomyces sp. NPDC093252]|uniref:NAD(P)/FAD-dependent oxidoreductase n=1 Tax=Streptomyces sp. NPDC093252 TaxID=3154980 RepID=UPI00343B2F61